MASLTCEEKFHRILRGKHISKEILGESEYLDGTYFFTIETFLKDFSRGKGKRTVLNGRGGGANFKCNSSSITW